MFKRIWGCAALLSILIAGGCGATGGDSVPSIGMIKGPTGIGASYLMEQNEQGLSAQKYNFGIFASPDEINAKLISGELDIAAVPTNSAAVLYAKTNGAVSVAAVHTLGTLYIVENGETITSLSDLRGKTLTMAGQGAVPEYALRYILESAGINPDSDLVIDFKNEHAEVATLMTAGEISLALLPEPNVTSVMMNNTETRMALDLNGEWRKAAALKGDTGSELTMGVLVVQKAFLENHKEVFDKFLEEYSASISYVNAHVSEAAALCEKFQIIPKAQIAERAIPNCSITYIDGDMMANAVSSFLDILYRANPASVGGKPPAADFYYEK